MSTGQSNATREPLKALMRRVVADQISSNPQDAVPLIVASIPDGELRSRLGEAISSMLPTIVSPSGVHLDRPRSSRRVAAVRDWWQQLLRSRVLTSSGWKFLGDASADDLRFVASHRRNQAADLLAVAERFEALAETMESRDLAVFKELDPNDLSNLGRAAA